jgi:hypothetical protein
MNMTIKQRRVVMSRIHVACFVMLGFAASTCGAQAQIADGQALMQVPVEKSRQAIEDCRQQRLRGELPSYLASAQCSSPKIFAAWREAGYPHMDLITEWLTTREAASAQVDQHALTPEQFERQMADLTIRLTAEEQRRRAGLANTADNSLELQLPPATQVIGVATPPAQQKLAAKKSALARAAANTRFDDTTGSAGVRSMGPLTPLDASQPAAGTGGPFVPVPPGTPVPSRSTEGAGGLYAQVASQQSEAQARLAFRALQQQFPNLLGNRDAVIRRADLGAKGIFYRVEIGPLTSGQADDLCGNIKSGGGQCAPRFE